jgi:hypothetical protein
MNDLESRIRDELRGREGDAPSFDLSDARPVAGRARRRQILNAAGAGIGALAVAVALIAALGGLVRANRTPADPPPPAPAETGGLVLPIEYPVGEELPDLGDAPGPLAAVWLVPRGAGAAPEAVGLVEETGMFGTLPIDVFHDDPEGPEEVRVAMSADGRRLAYISPAGELVAHDLVSGESFPPLSESDFETRLGSTWVDATHLFGLVADGSDADGWVWEPGTAPKLVDTYAYAEGFDLWISQHGSGPEPWPGERGCTSPILLDGTGDYGVFTPGWGYTLEVPVLCDLLGIIDSEILLGHWNSDRLPGDWNDADDGNGTVVALEVRGVDSSFEDPSLRRVVATAGAPQRVAFAADLIGEALGAPSPSASSGFSTFSSALHEITIGHPAGWEVRPATEPWSFDRLTFDAPDVDVIFDPTHGDDLYLALVSKPLEGLSGEDWLEDRWRPGICAQAANAGEGGISFGGAPRYVSVTCGGGGTSAGGHYLRVATDTRGYLIYLHVADQLQETYDVEFFNGLLETLELE